MRTPAPAGSSRNGRNYIIADKIQICMLSEMKYDELIDTVGRLPVVDLASIVQLNGGTRATIRTQLSRWCQAGKLISLRRGMYVLPPRYRSSNPAALANAIYTPSYISAQWLLSFVGLIPEKSVTYTSVTTRKPATFENPFGTFRYRNIKTDAFFGYRTVDIAGARVLVAEPEKALLDLWHLEPGQWTVDRMEEMRFQNMEQIRSKRLREYAQRYDSPRLLAATETWLRLRDQEKEGTREL